MNLGYSEWCVVEFRKKHSVSSGDIIIAPVLASENAGVSGIQVGRMLACSQSIAKYYPE